MKKLLTLFTVLLLVVGFISGCSSIDKETNSQDSGSSGKSGHSLKGSKDEKYVMVTFLSGIEYWKGAYAGMKDAAKNFGVSTEYKGASEYDVNQEVTVLNQIIAQKPDGIIVTAINPDALVAPINQAVQSGIPVITFDSDAPKSKRYAYLGTSNYSAGENAAKKMAELTGKKGKVAVITVPGQQNHEERTDGFVETIKKDYPNMKVVSEQDGKSDQTKAADAMSGILQSHPDLVGVFTTEASEGVGAATAIKQASKVGDVHIISFDTDKGTLDMVKSGVIDATIAQGTWNMGYWGLNYLYNIKHGLAPEVSDWKNAGISPLPPTVDTGVNVVTKKNVKYFYTNK